MAVKRMSRYSVEGFAPFPVDMLRYDESWPATELDAGVMERLGDHVRHGPGVVAVTVRLATYSGEPTGGRWRSFGWTVVDGSFATA